MTTMTVAALSENVRTLERKLEDLEKKLEATMNASTETTRARRPTRSVDSAVSTRKLIGFHQALESELPRRVIDRSVSTTTLHDFVKGLQDIRSDG